MKAFRVLWSVLRRTSKLSGTRLFSQSHKSPALQFEEDSHNGIIVTESTLPSDSSIFKRELNFVLHDAKFNGKGGVWLSIPVDKSQLIPVAVDLGFDFHHAEKGYVMMNKWLPLDRENHLPANNSHSVGIGAVVVNERDEILLVVERNGLLKGKNWLKLPTGTVNVGEHLDAAACREVKEETNIDTEFESVLGMRHAHGLPFGKSDLFFLCSLRPLTHEITIQETELAAARWTPLKELRELSIARKSSEIQLMYEIAMHAKDRSKVVPWLASRTQSQFRKEPSMIYHSKSGGIK